jgi:hypothetical protein
VYLRLGEAMQPGYPTTLHFAQWPVVAFVLAMMFFSGVLGGYLFGLTHALRHRDDRQGPKSIWTHEDD